MEILLDGKLLAEKMDAEFALRVEKIRKNGLPVKLTAILVGNDPASETYVRMKGKRCNKLGMGSETINLPEETTQQQLLELIDKLNKDKETTGILTQLPLPKHINEQTILEAIDPSKDVDCFHPYNVGRLSIGSPVFLPATPAGIIALLERYGAILAGKRAVVIGRSNIVGKPVSMLLLSKNCTVTVCHSKTADLPGVVREGDIVVAAVGKAEMVRGDWIKPGAWVVDVGTNKLEDGRQVGDVAFDEAKEVAYAISPVPKGVGPMTITMLMENTIRSAELRANF
ncbi:MAG TPA: bifunctional 5,10-methylenetetrahydrofolate dehydrogenase/5,10-methenyltetrahydrofolate cyclohydrolase [Caldisericia bacterium]|nr:bifunctional 5,10-methylenetetrahydrofolate dehydrogenase/5,10-methenyltetrahydrofolate cyclohydrolase [Caldisericia bacterium]HOC78739.1 bifunctional 5,10-methylenetetrahydrofolate dehydrogenase/5,10-methenyltetrahydrofolate cyclohydrolase [Caldisericia bacterium]HOG70257.1 bifunctional 5,10-methylenetetrahydrofolate dehydrogenase/5,10-methenyltetrahydrofolate cyclohydrolase [Caldisericia bacterium]HPA65972.1 bifunctional 5,10-methylenetetrahydrofolate dehydrogenase/5,10-methenyltetrahydrofo